MVLTLAQVREIDAATLHVIEPGDEGYPGLHLINNVAPRPEGNHRQLAASMVKDYLNELGLVLYGLADGGYLLGHGAELGLCPHENWLYYSAEGHIWGRIHSERFTNHFEWLNGENHGLLTELNVLGDLCFFTSEMMTEDHRKPLSYSEIIWHAHVLATNDIEWLSRATLPPNLGDLHELICHPDIWIAAHPEAADLPRETLLRMYGLGPCIDSRPEGEGEL